MDFHIMYFKNGNQIDFNTQPWNEYSLKVSSTALLLVNDKDRNKIYDKKKIIQAPHKISGRFCL